MIKHISKKIIAIILLIFILMGTFQNVVNAVDISSATIEKLGDCGYHLMFWDSNKSIWSYVITTMAGYRENGNLHYAYCLNVDKKGVGDAGSYAVSVDNVISDNRVYRVITNGFPYNNMGLNDQDAFVATKHAVYCIIYNRDVRSFYKGGDERGNQIVNAIENLVSIGRNGTQTQNSVSNVTINKIGDVVEDSRAGFYSQTCSVSSSIEMGEYTITGLNGMPEGTYTADLSGNQKNTFAGNERFKIVVPENKITGIINGNVNITGTIKSYPVFYGQAPNSSVQNYALTYRAYSTMNANGNIQMDIFKSSINIIKEDDYTKKRLEGVQFSFKYENGTYIGDYKTNSNGEITINKLRKGKVIATEISTNEKYILKTEPINIDLKFNDVKTITVENEHKKGNLSLYKADKDNNKIALGNVEFDLYSYEFQKVIGTYHTDVNRNDRNKRFKNWRLSV